MDAWIGIDIAKETLDACLLRSSGKPLSRQFQNTPAGHEKLLRWVRSLTDGSRHFCLEATGAYSHALASFLVERSERVSVENPARVKYFGMGEGILNKTDKADARLIARYCQQKQPEDWRMSKPEVRELAALMHRLQALQNHLAQERNRQEEPALHPKVLRSIQTLIQVLEEEIRLLESQIQSHIDQHPDLQADKELLLSIPGIGEKLAHWILAELPDAKVFASAKSAAAFAGLSPREYTSGRSVRRRTRLSKAGNDNLRRALYMPAMAAARHNPLVADLYRRLINQGKTRMAALGAAMRKLLMLAYGVLKTRQKFDPQYAAAKA